MKSKKRYAKTFYARRHLPTPRTEYWPEDAGELRQLLKEPADLPLVLVGDGQHLRSSMIGERSFDVIRTESLNQIISVDRESKLLRVEAGLRWADFQEAARDRGLSMERTRLYPLSSTIGGLIARHDSCPRELWDGDLRGFMVALTGITPRHDDYTYLAAPRKASGPDLRWLFAGSEGLLGAVLDATFVAWKPMDGRLWRFTSEDFESCVGIYRAVLDSGIRVSWAHYSDGTLSVASHGLERVLKVADTIVQRLEGRMDGGAAEVEALRHTLESEHPDRREAANSGRMVSVTASLKDLALVHQIIAVEAEEIQIYDLTRHRGTLYARYPKGHVGAELPGAIAGLVLDAHVVANDEAVHWPHWAQNLKRELDPKRTLAMGP